MMTTTCWIFCAAVPPSPPPPLLPPLLLLLPSAPPSLAAMVEDAPPHPWRTTKRKPTKGAERRRSTCRMTALSCIRRTNRISVRLRGSAALHARARRTAAGPPEPARFSAGSRTRSPEPRMRVSSSRPVMLSRASSGSARSAGHEPVAVVAVDPRGERSRAARRPAARAPRARASPRPSAARAAAGTPGRRRSASTAARRCSAAARAGRPRRRRARGRRVRSLSSRASSGATMAMVPSSSASSCELKGYAATALSAGARRLVARTTTQLVAEQRRRRLDELGVVDERQLVHQEQRPAAHGHHVGVKGAGVDALGVCCGKTQRDGSSRWRRASVWLASRVCRAG